MGLMASKPALVRTPHASPDRCIRVFISSTFRDMAGERDALMTHTWPALRRLCQERYVDLVEVDLRWGITEDQSTRQEVLKLCLDEISACRPYFIGLLGERYGSTPDVGSFTADLLEEQPWLEGLRGRSVTELEILHGVLNNPDMAGRSFFYFRDPAYARGRGPGFLPETAADAERQSALKDLIRATCGTKGIPVREDYSDPGSLAALVLADLSAVIEAQYSADECPDPLAREAQAHEAFAGMHRRAYIGRPVQTDALDRHAAGTGGPLLVLGESGSGKSALLANWAYAWRTAHPADIVIQHYIGGTGGSTDHWRLMARVMAEIKERSSDPEALPVDRESTRRDFPRWLAKARAWAERRGVRFILVLDALNQLEDHDGARLLAWLPEPPFTGALRLVASALPGSAGSDDPLAAARARGWSELRIGPLERDERRRMIAGYLARFGKKLDERHLDRLSSAAQAASPLYLKILLDELRVTGTFTGLDERLGDYLSAADIPALLGKVLARYRHDYERDRPGLVRDALSLIWAARRGLSEPELRALLRPAGQPQLPAAVWSPLRAALAESLVDSGGTLNFAHDHFRAAVEAACVPGKDQQRTARRVLADEFERQPATARSCDELPWLLRQTGESTRLRGILLEIDRFQLILERDEDELMRYWVWLEEVRTMGRDYVGSLERWSAVPGRDGARVFSAAHRLAYFLMTAALYGEAEPLLRWALAVAEKSVGDDHRHVPECLHNLAQLLVATNRPAEAEPLVRRALAMDEADLGADHPHIAYHLTSLASILRAANRPAEAEPLLRRALAIQERHFGPDHPRVATRCNDLGVLLRAAGRIAEAEPLLRRALAVYEANLGPNHPDLAGALVNLAGLLQDANRPAEAEPLLRRSLAISEANLGPDHPSVAVDLNNLGELLKAGGHLAEAEPLMRRALAIDERSYGPDHPETAIKLNNLGNLLKASGRIGEAEPLLRRSLAIHERSLGPDHPGVAIALNNLADLLKDTGRLAEAEPLMRRALTIDEKGLEPGHPDIALRLTNLAGLLISTNRTKQAIPLIERSLRINEACFGPDHPKTALSLAWLADAYADGGRFAEAEPLMRRVLAIDEHSLGPDHPDVASDLNNLGHLLQVTNRRSEAEPLVRRALEIFLKATRDAGRQHPLLTRALNEYASVLGGMGLAPSQIRQRIEAVLAAYGLSLGG